MAGIGGVVRVHSIDQINAREAEIRKVTHSEEDVAALRKHFGEIIEGKAFNGSQRCVQFLIYIVEHALAGDFDSLKERMIGVELFGRSPTYDTREDAIVRVTASDVRRRLQLHYSSYGVTSGFRISLGLGSYIPEIVRIKSDEPSLLNTTETDQDHPAAPHNPVDAHHNSPTAPKEPDAIPVILPSPSTRHGNRHWLTFGILFIAANIAVWCIFWMHSSRAKVAPVSILPWSALFASPHATQIITSDANMAALRALTGASISASDYINHNYIFGPNKGANDADRLRDIVRTGGFAATVDVQIVANIAELAQASSRRIFTNGARNIQLSNLRTDDNFIFLGSMHTNPWVSLFSDQLDFRFVDDKDTGREFIRNVHPRPNEQAEYVPTALGWGTGQSFAVIAFVQNFDQSGQVLILAGLSAEGTEAAGKLATDLPGLTAKLQQCGIPPSGPLRHFEMLLRLNTLGGSPTEAEVVACHILSGVASH